jgi:hypothetical protein
LPGTSNTLTMENCQPLCMEVTQVCSLSCVFISHLLELKRGLVLRFWIIKLFVVADPKSCLKEHFESNRITPLDDEEYSMSRDQFQRMHQHFHFPIQLFGLFNQKFSSFVCLLDRCYLYFLFTS